jgi:hypothetical protein
MRSRLRRGAVVAAGVCLASLCAVSPASAATGVFNYVTFPAGSGTITNPVNGVCYPTALGRSASNQTTSVAKLYADGDCSLFSTSLNPGDSSTILAFDSVRFT